MKLLIFSFLLLTSTIAASEIGDYPIQHFKGEDGASFKSNVVFEDAFGNIYSGTDNGVKVFKGGVWEDYFYSGKAIHQLITNEDGELIVGGQTYFGTLIVDSLGSIRLLELSTSLSGERSFQQLKKMLSYRDGSFFHVDNRIVKINDKITDYNFEDVLFAGQFNQNILIQRQGQGLFLYAGNDFRRLNGSEQYSNEEILSLIDLKNGSFILLFEDKAVQYDGENFIAKRFNALRNLEFNATVKNAKGIFISTLDKGIYQFTEDGEVVRNIMLDSWCNNIYSDSDQNLWISNNDGVSLLKTSSSFMLIPFDEEKGRAVTAFKELLYFGTSRGTYTIPISNFYREGGPMNFRSINNESVNSFLQLEGELFIASKNSEKFGINTNQLMYLEDAGILLKADKSGLGFYEKSYRQWVFANHLYGLEEEVKKVVRDGAGNLWAHASRSGIVRLNFDPILNTISPEIYTVDDIRADRINGIFLINGLPIVTTASGVFEFNQQVGKFQQSEKYNDLFGVGNDILYLHQDDSEDIWFISEAESGIISIVDKGVQKSAEKISIPELAAYINVDQPGIYGMPSNAVVINGLDGFIYIDKANISPPKDFTLKLHRIQNTGMNSNVFLPSSQSDQVFEFPREHNEVILSFGSSHDLYQDKLEYSYNVNETEWSEWDESNVIKVELQGGSNSVKARARAGIDIISNTFAVPIVVTQQWYFEPWVLYAASVVGLLLLVLLAYNIRRLFKKRNRRINDLMEENRNQKREIRELGEKNEVLSAQLISAIGDTDIQTQLKRLSDENDSPEVKKAAKKLNKKLKTERQKTSSLIVADPELISKLKVKYPTLTKKDLRLCSLLKMDLTTKEIAPMLDITVRGVEISRYRLRKKLELNNEVVLADFLKNL